MLNEIFNKWGSDKGDQNGAKHNYANFYERFVGNKKDNELLILEIGVDNGNSLRAWYEYFPKGTILGLDINDKTGFDNDRVSTFVLDQSDENQLINFSNECREKGYEFDVILDDGSHHMLDQQITFGYLFPLLKSKGVYFIEDLHTSLSDNEFPLYWRNLDIQENRKNTTLFYLMESFNSTYLKAEQNKYIQENIDVIEISNYFNSNQEAQYKYRSITSAITKK